jgi:hypothetical protein
MLSSKLTSTDRRIISHSESIPEGIRHLIERRTDNNKRFGILEITAPQQVAIAANAHHHRRNIIAGFLLDISGSMEGRKLQNAINTIKQLAKVIISEQTIRAWLYVITFDSTADLVIPFEEITETTLKDINSKLDKIHTKGATNYERAFQKQTEVLDDIITQKLDPAERYHIIRFFETDGEITDGTSDVSKLYEMMRTTRIKETDADMSLRESALVSIEDYILGYGTEIDLTCLKTLASPHAPSSSSSSSTPGVEYNCSSLITIIKPEDIGWQVGELLFKVITRFGTKVTVTVSACELFEYQTHQWSTSTIFHSIIYGETKTLYIQYTPPHVHHHEDSDVIHVRIQYENQYTGSIHNVAFEHHAADHAADPPPVPDITITSIAPIIFGMIQIEIFKQFREIENPMSKYDNDRIVSEAYKTIRMLKAYDAMTSASASASASQYHNLMTDAKLIIGLTTINNTREQECIIHARRISSAQKDIFNTGAFVSRKYVENEEDYEDIAREVIKTYGPKATVQEAATQEAAILDTQCDDDDDDNDDNDDDNVPTYISRIATATTTRTGPIGGKPSTIRRLCARIAQSKHNNEDKSPELIYQEMRQHRAHDYNNDYCYSNQHDDPFSSTPSQDDEYTQRRMNIMRQVSSPSQP